MKAPFGTKPLFHLPAFAIYILYAFFGFVCGYVVTIHQRNSLPWEVRNEHLQIAGDAPPEVRAGVIKTLSTLQDGYIERNPKNLDRYMSRLFPKDGNVIFQGTDGEWVRSYASVADLVQADWHNWGDLRFVTDRAVVWSSGSVAWAATVGVVHFKWSDRPVRLSAIMVHEGDEWLIHELQIQYDDRDPGFREVFWSDSSRRTLKLIIDRLAGHAPSF